MPQTPLSLTDAEYDAIMQAAAPVHPSERGLFLLALAEELERHPVRGVGLVHRLAAQLQKQFVVQARSDAETGKGETHGHRGPRQASQAAPPGRHRSPAGPETPAVERPATRPL
jgi:hypothetical protein